LGGLTSKREFGACCTDTGSAWFTVNRLKRFERRDHADDQVPEDDDLIEVRDREE
jgi:hypothetical protein